jgi:hypothetical protein
VLPGALFASYSRLEITHYFLFSSNTHSSTKLASNFTTFFEKLSRLIERLTMSLPQYAEFYQSLCSGINRFSPRLETSLVKFYVDMFDLFQAIARVFSRPNGSMALSSNTSSRRVSTH